MAPKKPPPDVTPLFSNAPDDRRAALTAVRKTILDNLPKGYVESSDRGMLTYEVPLSVYPDTYNKKPLLYAALANQKSFMAIYLCSLYVSDRLTAEFKARFAKAGKRLDMGKSCVRFKDVDDLELGAVAAAIRSTPMADYVATAKAAHSKEAVAARRGARSKAAAKKGAPKAVTKTKA